MDFDIVDLHTHILPGLDDGVKKWEEAVEICRVAIEMGIKTIGVTPHFFPGRYEPKKEKVLQKTCELKRKLEAEGVDLQIIPGAEIRLFGGLIEKIKTGEILTFNDAGKFIFLEIPSTLPLSLVRNYLFSLQVEGIVPIISHPERNLNSTKDLYLIDDLIRKGALVQVSVPSVVGHFGRKAKKAAKILLKSRLVHLIASDTHSLRGLYALDESLEIISKWVGEEEVLKLLKENPEKIIAGERPENLNARVVKRGNIFARYLKKRF